LIKADDSDVVLVAISGYNLPNIPDGLLLRTTDGGLNWQKLIGRPTTALATYLSDPELFFLGTNGQGAFGPERCGTFKMSDNAGASWGNLLSGTDPDEECLFSQVHDIETGWNYRIYIATSAGLWRYTGLGWADPSTVSGLPGVVSTLAIDMSTQPETAYAGIWGHGVFQSSDGGGSWTPFNEGLEHLSITELAMNQTESKMLYAGTADGGVWSTPVPEPSRIALNISGLSLLGYLYYRRSRKQVT
jgi:photosystem II stability/assembly factor-like uncharacterized protein